MVSFGEVLAAWYGPKWRRVAPAALGRSRRTLARWCADDRRVPRWVWRRFTSDRVLDKWREIDRRAASERARSHAAQGDRKSASISPRGSLMCGFREPSLSRLGGVAGRRNQSLGDSLSALSCPP